MAARRIARAPPGPITMDELTVWTLFVVIGLTALTVLLTGPGLWSEKWGWWWVGKRRRVGDQHKDDEEP